MAAPLALQDFSKTRQDLLHARHLPGEFYTSPEIFQKEIEQIFMKDWVCVGRVEQYAKPGRLPRPADCRRARPCL